MKTVKRVIITFTFLFIVAIGLDYGYDVYPNFHTVSIGELYRSKQMSPEQLDHYIHKYAIKTVINLRGESSESSWYQKEITTCKQDSVLHIDHHWSATHRVLAKEIDSLLTFAHTLPKPILVHCQGGADRTGLFCAAWKFKFENLSPSTALSQQLTWKYGHLPAVWLYKRTVAMDSSFVEYVRVYAGLR